MTKRRVMPGMIRERVTERVRALIADAHSILRVLGITERKLQYLVDAHVKRRSRQASAIP
jgi:hypothetical protein